MKGLTEYKPPGVSLSDLFPELNLPDEIKKQTVMGVQTDSRAVGNGDLFIALRGARADGRQFIDRAVAQGAVAAAVESTLDCKAGSIAWRGEVPILSVAHLAERVSAIAGQCYGDPSIQMKVVGVTGTNGKSTCVSLIAQLYDRCRGEGRAATLGTLGLKIGEQAFADYGLTTPDAARCQLVLAQLRQHNTELVALEVSSHGLNQNRVAGIKFAGGIFTNISHDHLDYHGTMEQYAAAKMKLFESFGLQTAVINLDDPFAAQMVAAAKGHAQVLTYSLLHFAADIYASEMEFSKAGVHFQLVTPWGTASLASPLLGEFNVYNLIAAIAGVCANGCDFEQVIKAVPYLLSVPGRMEKVSHSSDILVVVDYAHTPDALAQAIAATRVHTSGRLTVVFGCGGDRDKAKRPKMATIAERYADMVYVTSDNPRGEDPGSIVDDICKGFAGDAHVTDLDRASAITRAILSARSGDVVLLAGKGHESFQWVGDQKRPFSDLATAESALQARVQKKSWSPAS